MSISRLFSLLIALALTLAPVSMLGSGAHAMSGAASAETGAMVHAAGSLAEDCHGDTTDEPAGELPGQCCAAMCVGMPSIPPIADTAAITPAATLYPALVASVHGSIRDLELPPPRLS